MDKLIEKALAATKESKYIEFKAEFDATSSAEWCEIIKDIIALHNSGGGIILFGVNDDGSCSGKNVDSLFVLDVAEITDKIQKYVGVQFSEFEVLEKEKDGQRIAALVVDASRIPLVFKKPGSYSVGNGKQKVAFKEGSVYFRHEAKSSPGYTDDLRRSVDKNLNIVQKSWLGNINKVVNASPKSEVVLVPAGTEDSAKGKAALIRLTDDPNAKTYGKMDFDLTHPFRQKELIEKVSFALGQNAVFNSYDVQAIWNAHDIGDHPEFFHAPKFGSTQYSREYVDWIVNNVKKERRFLREAREKYYEIKKQQSNKFKN